MEFYLLVLINGLAYAALLFLLAAGLSLVYGVGRVLHLAHGGFHAGGYLGYTLYHWSGNFWLGLVLVPACALAVGWATERLIRLVYGPEKALEQVLFTFGLAFVISDLTRLLWGPRCWGFQFPLLNRPVVLGPLIYPVYPSSSS